MACSDSKIHVASLPKRSGVGDSVVDGVGIAAA